RIVDGGCGDGHLVGEWSRNPSVWQVEVVVSAPFISRLTLGRIQQEAAAKGGRSKTAHAGRLAQASCPLDFSGASGGPSAPGKLVSACAVGELSARFSPTSGLVAFALVGHGENPFVPSPTHCPQALGTDSTHSVTWLCS